MCGDSSSGGRRLELLGNILTILMKTSLMMISHTTNKGCQARRNNLILQNQARKHDLALSEPPEDRKHTGFSQCSDTNKIHEIKMLYKKTKYCFC